MMYDVFASPTVKKRGEKQKNRLKVSRFGNFSYLCAVNNVKGGLRNEE
jgi:hypothetical protein